MVQLSDMVLHILRISYYASQYAAILNLIKLQLIFQGISFFETAHFVL